jgi:predicted  nucleic acid-binding Zn-ribbon protein
MKIKSLFITLLALTSLFSALEAKDHSIENLDAQIEQINKQIQEIHLKMMKDKVDSENYIKYEWSDYSKQMQKIETDQKNLQELQQKLQAAILQKQNLLNVENPEK